LGLGAWGLLWVVPDRKKSRKGNQWRKKLVTNPFQFIFAVDKFGVISPNLHARHYKNNIMTVFQSYLPI